MLRAGLSPITSHVSQPRKRPSAGIPLHKHATAAQALITELRSPIRRDEVRFGSSTDANVERMLLIGRSSIGLPIQLALNSQRPVLRRSCGISNGLAVIGAHPPSRNVRDTV